MLLNDFFSFGPSNLTLGCNIDPRQPHSSHYRLRAIAWANFALMSQTRRTMHKKPFYIIFMTLAMQDFRLKCVYIGNC